MIIFCLPVTESLRVFVLEPKCAKIADQILRFQASYFSVKNEGKNIRSLKAAKVLIKRPLFQILSSNRSLKKKYQIIINFLRIYYVVKSFTFFSTLQSSEIGEQFPLIKKLFVLHFRRRFLDEKGSSIFYQVVCSLNSKRISISL